MQSTLCCIVAYSGGMNVGQPRIQGLTVGLVIYRGLARNLKGTVKIFPGGFD